MRRRTLIEVQSPKPAIKEFIEGDILEEAPGGVLLEKLNVWEKAPGEQYMLAEQTLDPDEEGKAYVVVRFTPDGPEAHYFDNEMSARQFFGEEVVILQRDFPEEGVPFP